MIFFTKKKSSQFFFGLFFVTLIIAGHPISIDGAFNDWNTVPVAYEDDSNDYDEADFHILKITEDNNFIFIYLSFYSYEFLMQNWNDFHLYIDADDDSLTGFNIGGIGAELEWIFGSRTGQSYINDSQSEIYQNDINLRIAPTTTSNKFEIAISKNSDVLTLGGDQIFSKGRFVLTEKENGGDILPDNTDEILFEFYDQLVQEPIPTPLDRKSEQDIRLVSYNTLNEGILDPNRQSHFKRIIQALDPDIIALQEHSEWGSIEDIIQSWFPNDNWNASWTYGDLVVLSNFSIISHTQLSSDRSMAVLIETVDRIGKNLLVFNSHLSCCSNDEDRQDQVDSFTSDWREWRLNNTVPFEIEESTPFIHVGDFNFVGYRKQVETIRLGNIDNENEFGNDFYPDWDSTPIVELYPRHTHKRMGYTWRNDNSSFNPGKLDYIFYSDATIDSGRNYILNTLSMDQASLNQYSLQEADTEIASDHLPLVFDIKVDQDLGYYDVSKLKETTVKCFAYPNPFNSRVKIEFSTSKSTSLIVNIFDVNGKLINRLFDGFMGKGLHSLDWNGKTNKGYECSSGIYFIDYRTDQKIYKQRLIYLK